MFNKETEYALRGLVYIQTQNLSSRRPGITEIAREIGAPHFYTAKILQQMVRIGFIRSVKGKGGGFYFEPGQNELHLKDLVFAIEGGKTFSGCGFGLKQCDNDNPCPLHEDYARVRESINKLLSEETIQNLARKTMKNKDAIKYT